MELPNDLLGLKTEIRNARRDVLSQNLTGKKRRDALVARLKPLQSQRKAAQHEAMQMLQHLAPQISRLIDQFNAAGPQPTGHPLVQNAPRDSTGNLQSHSVGSASVRFVRWANHTMACVSSHCSRAAPP